MKFLESTFEEYTNKVKQENLHKKHVQLFKNMPTTLREMNNIIFYGPKGIGKYSQALSLISKYSPSSLKYEKKFTMEFKNKYEYIFKISDIHYEVDMSMLGCNARTLWSDIYNHIKDIIASKSVKEGIIVCKYFNHIHSELLDVFYNYMNDITPNLNIKFILITEELSFMPDNILNYCDIISFQRPTKTAYNKCIAPAKIPVGILADKITNIKNLKANITQLMNPHEIMCNKLIKKITDIDGIQNNTLDLFDLRDNLYDILIYHLDVYECIWYIILSLKSTNHIKPHQYFDINKMVYDFFKYYNNNYRPIFHLEKFILYLCKIVHGL
jgi:hypothetical protein